MKRTLLLFVVMIAFLVSCAAPQSDFVPVGTVTKVEYHDGAPYVHIIHASGDEYACEVNETFVDLLDDGITASGEKFDCTGLPVIKVSHTVTF